MKTRLKLIVTAGICAAIPSTLAAAEAREHWTQQCAKCHGPDGAGKTPTGRMLKLKDYTDPAVQAAITDEDIARAIKEGIKNDAGKQVMVPFAEKIPEEDIPALVALVRSFEKE